MDFEQRLQQTHAKTMAKYSDMTTPEDEDREYEMWCEEIAMKRWGKQPRHGFISVRCPACDALVRPAASADALCIPIHK